jgi:hypothetical protein
MRVKLDFQGGALPLFGYTLIAMILSMFIIPAAWGAVILYVWIAQNTRPSDGSTVAFAGKGGEIWWAFVLGMLAMQLPNILMRFMVEPGGQPSGGVLTVFLLSLFIAMAVSFYFYFLVLRWFVNSIQFSWGGKLAFNGSFLGYIGWIILMYLSAFLIIVPFWVISAMIRWIFNNTSSSAGDRLVWTGTGWGLLWRVVVMYILCIFIIPIPWAIRWFAQWFISCVEIEKAQASVQAAQPAPAMA